VGLDIRLPIGLMFLIIGTVLMVFGLFTNNDQAIYQPSLGTNVNLWWGICLLVFGALMFHYGRLATAAHRTEGMHPSQSSIEGRLMEEREHEQGLEKGR